ncbi:TPA: hypothetical protein N0F65_003890 [Lagenidium giganteum]|uniref:LAA1-like C-terminal TPR repeats domain-containing protein n=1 Tax=Lagenidium giganteum TaxID=4803 RepID=A0AAV2ZFB3_9STRA|nr:TPA: hypothetical protein N0F65_003890 [Lagenidium giganteum]
MEAIVERLSACVEELRNAGSHADVQALQRKLLKELFSVRAQLAAAAAASTSGRAPQGSLFHLMLQALLVYSGNHTGNTSSGTSGTNSTIAMALTSSGAASSECVQQLLVECMAITYEFSAASAMNELLASKNVSIYIKTSIAMVVSFLPSNDANQFIPEVMGFANRNIKNADYYMKQCLLESVTRLLESENPPLTTFHVEALKIVSKTFQDKTPEVRAKAADLLHSIARFTSTLSSASASSSHGSASSASAAAGSVTLEAVMQIALKGMDDTSLDARRAYATVVGVVLAKFAMSSSEDASASMASVLAARNGDDDDGRPSDQEQGGQKSKLSFKLGGMHVPGLSLSRRKTVVVSFSNIASVVMYLREILTTKYLVGTQNNGGMLASYAIALCGMFERLPRDAMNESQLSEVLEAVLSILDHPFALGDLSRARNAACFVLRNGLNSCLMERQREALCGVYLKTLRDEMEGNHHKLLSVLVEVSHVFQSRGEAAVVYAQDATSTLQALLAHEKQSVRFQSAVAMASLMTAVPYRLKSVLDESIKKLRETTAILLHDSAASDASGQEKSKTHLYLVQGQSSAISHIVRALKIQGSGGLSHAVLGSVLELAVELIKSQFVETHADSVWLTCTRAGWNLLGNLVVIEDANWIQSVAHRLVSLWLKASVLHSREPSLELLRIEAAVGALQCFLTSCADMVAKLDGVLPVLAHILRVYVVATQDQLSNPQKRRGQVARYRLITGIMKCYALLPPIYSDSYMLLLDLIAEFTTAQSLTSLNHSSLVPASSTYLHNAMSGVDDALEMISTSRLVPSDDPDVLYCRELNHVLVMLQHEHALTDVEVEVQYLDTFWGLCCEQDGENETHRRGICSSFTYVRLVDASVFLFGKLFHFVPDELQLRCLQHYAGVLADGRVDCEVNVCSLLFAAIKEARDAHESLTATAFWPQQVQTMMCEMISSENDRVRRGAGEALGMLSSLLGEAKCKTLVHEIEKRLIVDKLPSGGNHDSSVLFAGAAFALACIKRVCGSRVSIDTGLIFRFGGEISQPLRPWILHAWSVVIESVSSNSDFEQYVKSSMSLIEAHILAGFHHSKTNKKGLRWQISTKIAIGRIINGVVATLGPDLASAKNRLNEFYTVWGLLRQDGDTRIELEFLKFIEQVVVFAPAHFRKGDLKHILGIVSTSDAFVSRTDSFAHPLIALDKVKLAPINGLSRNILQQVGMSCIRTLVERDPTTINRYKLQCVLFHAMHAEYTSFTWRYLPGLHGMWDFLAFKFHVPCKTRNGLEEIRDTILALIDIDAGTRRGANPCVWALFCRGIAIGESGESISNDNSEQLLMSPRNADAAPPTSGNNNSVTDAWGAKAASADDLDIAANSRQIEVWRETKVQVVDLLKNLPGLSRRVRMFAVDCVLHVFDMIGASGTKASQHFDLQATRQHFFEEVKAAQEASSPITTSTVEDNFLCMYLDEFVTLACQVATTSAEGFELQLFQHAGQRFLRVVVQKFANVKDPEVPTGDAYLLDPYQAQISSAIRHALKQTQPTSDGTSVEFFAPLAVEARMTCGGAISNRQVQDKVALGRILKMIVSDDYGHPQYIGDESNRICLALSSLTCLADLLSSSVNAALKSDRYRLTADPLVKATMSAIGSGFDYLIKCWMDITHGYGCVMQGSSGWPVVESLKARSNGPVQSATLHLALFTGGSLPPSKLNELRVVYKRSWPAVVNALAVCWSDLDLQAERSALNVTVLLSFASYHMMSIIREGDESSLIPVLHAIPTLLRLLRDSPDQRQLGSIFAGIVETLITVALHVVGQTRVEVVQTLFTCLSGDLIESAKGDPQANQQVLTQLLGDAALCPLECVRASLDVHDGHTVTNVERNQVKDLIQLAAKGIVLIHKTAGIQARAVDALRELRQCYPFLHLSPEVIEASLAVSRASVESVAAFFKNVADDDAANRQNVSDVIHQSMAYLLKWIKSLLATTGSEVATQLDYAFRVTVSYQTRLPSCVTPMMNSFHIALCGLAQDLLKDWKNTSKLTTRLLHGIRAIVQKLADIEDVNNVAVYASSLGPALVDVVDAFSATSAVASEIEVLDEVEALLRLLSTQMQEDFGSAFVRLMLPKLAQVLANQSSSTASGNQVAGIMARLLLCFAQTRSIAFKEVVVAMPTTQRGVLESTLRSALTGGAAAPSAGAAPRRLDLSRYG